MTESNKKISLTLTLDGAQFVATMNGSTIATQKFALELPKIPPAVKNVTGSLNDLNARLKQAREELNSISKENVRYEATLKRVQVLQEHVKNSTERSNKTFSEAKKDLSAYGAASGNVGYAVLNMNRIISDSPWGFIAISNNIEPLFNSFTTLTQKTGSFTSAALLMGKSLMGPLGVTTAVSLATAALTYFTLHTSRSTSAAETNKTAIENLIEPYSDIKDIISSLDKEIEQMSLDELDAAFVKLHKKLEDLGRVAPGIIDQIWDGLTFKPLTDQFGFDNWLLNEIQRTPVIFGDEGSKDKKGIKDTELAIERVKKYGETVKKALSGNFDFKSATKAELKQYTNVIETYLDNWAGNAQQKSISIGDRLKGTFMELGTYDKAKLEKLKSSIDSVLKPKDKKDEGKEELELFRLRFELNKISLEDYRAYLKGRLSSAKQGTAEEMRLYVELKDELKKVTGIYKPEINEDFNFATEAQEKVFKKLKDSFERQGIAWDNNAKALVLKIALSTGEAPTDKLKPVNAPKQKDLKFDLGGEEFDTVRLQAQMLQETAVMAGEAIIDAFSGVKLTMGEVVSQISLMIAKMVLLAGIKMGLKAAFPVLAPLFHTGGSADKPQMFGVVDGSVFRGAPRYHGGREVPAILQSDEVVYTADQQKRLNRALGNLKGLSQQGSGQFVFIFKNLLDGQRFIMDSMNKQAASIR